MQEEESKEVEKPLEEKDIFGDIDSDSIDTDHEEFTHEGKTLVKTADEENEGCFLIYHHLDGDEDDKYTLWGTMDAEVQQLVPAGAAVNQSKNNGTTPLRIAIFNKHHAIVEMLREAGAKE